MERLAYEDVLSFAQSWAGVYFSVMFLIAAAYAWWPKNRARFEEAALIPLKDEETP